MFRTGKKELKPPNLTPKQLDELCDIADKERVHDFDDYQTVMRRLPKLLEDLCSLQGVVEVLAEQDCWCQYNAAGELINGTRCTSCRAKLVMGQNVVSRTPASMTKSSMTELNQSLNDIKHTIRSRLKEHKDPNFFGVMFILPSWLTDEQYVRFASCVRSQGYENVKAWVQKLIEEAIHGA